MERCPDCGRMTYGYDYSRQTWVCVCYDCGAESRTREKERGGTTPDRMEPRREPETRSTQVHL